MNQKNEYRGLDILDYLLIILKYKIQLIVTSILVVILSYISIRIFINEQFDSRALILATESESTAGFGSLLNSFSNLPINIGGLSGGGNNELFTTIVYSRTNLEDVINNFGLFEEYGEESMSETVEALSDNITAGETETGAFEIIVRASSPQKAADIANYIVKKINNSLIQLNIAKSKANRIFLEQRYNDITRNLVLAEDSLTLFQNQSGIMQLEEQARVSLEAYSKIQAEIFSKQIEMDVIKEIYGKNSPNLRTVELTLTELKKQFNKIMQGESEKGLILPLKQMPQKSMEYIRYYRNVEIYNKMLEFIVPLYEQARFDEQKDTPILQIIDKAVPIKKKAYPPRTLFAIIFTFIVMLTIISFIVFKESINSSQNPKIKLIRKNIFLDKE